MARREPRMRVCTLMMAAWLLFGAADAAGAEPRVVPLHAAPPTSNELGFDVSYESQTFPSLDAALQDCREGRVARADCDARPIVAQAGTEIISLAARWAEDGRPMLGTELLARDTATRRVRTLFRVTIEQSFGATSHIEVFASPAGPLLRVPVLLSGTGAFNRHFHFLWRDGAWQEIDAEGWLRAVALPPGHGIWKGVIMEPRDFTARSAIWREGDGNCCPSGGEVEVRLTLRGRTLEIASQTYRPPRAE